MLHCPFHALARFAAALAVVAATWAITDRGLAQVDNPSQKTDKPSHKEPVSTEQINGLIKHLGDKDYYVRQRAQDELARLGFEAFDALNAATTNEDLEIASRAKYLLRLMRVEWTAESDPPEVKRCLHDYEFEDAQSREAKMRALAALPGGQGMAALCRLVRFEKAIVLSKSAAVALLTSQTNADPPETATIETVRKSLDNCKRPGAVWLLLWTRLGSEPEAVVSQWTKLIDDEQKLTRSSASETSPEIIAGLTRFQIARLRKLGKTDEAMVAIHRLVALERGTPESLAELLDWLVEQKAWKAVDELAERFKTQFDAEPGLLYTLAEAYAEQGQKDRSEETAARAFHHFAGKQQKHLLQHLVLAQHLRERGQFAWARREFDHVIQQGGGPENDELRAEAQSRLAEMLHDQGQDLEAAEVLEKLVKTIDAGQVTENELNGRKPSEVRSRMHYFFACHWETKGEAAKHRQALDKALRAEPTDIDVLIACYRLPEQTPEYHTKILDLIRKAAAEAREQIAEEPESPSPYNQFAWLIGNTEGDFDEALKYSKKSIELKPEEGGFYDTLARVYFAKGDVENAVKQQTKATELDPHSGLIRRQLEFFRKKLEEKKSS